MSYSAYSAYPTYPEYPPYPTSDSYNSYNSYERRAGVKGNSHRNAHSEVGHRYHVPRDDPRSIVNMHNNRPAVSYTLGDVPPPTVPPTPPLRRARFSPSPPLRRARRSHFADVPVTRSHDYYSEGSSISSVSDSDSGSDSDSDRDFERQFGDTEADISQVPLRFDNEAIEYALTPKTLSQKATLQAKLTAGLEPQSAPEPEPKPEPKPERAPQPIESNTAYSVLTASYTKEEGTQSHLSAEIEYVTTNSLRRDQAVFQWIHLNQRAMDFDRFSQCAQSITGLSQSQRQEVVGFLRNIRKEHETPIRTQGGSAGNFMKPDCINNFSQKSSLLRDRGYFFCSLPFHHLTSYSPLPTGTNSRLHPTRTLLQYKYPSTKKQRDLEQAVCSISGTPKNHCFHISTLWCLIIYNKYMITAANGLSALEIAGKHVKLTPKILPDLNHSAPLGQILRVFVGDRLYTLPLAQWDSWFKFMQNFSHITLSFMDNYIVRWNDEEVTPELWPLIVNQSRKQILSISILKRKKPIPQRPGNVGNGSEEPGADNYMLRPPSPNDDRLSIISEADSLLSGRSNKSQGVGSESSTPAARSPSPDNRSNSPSNNLQSPKQTRDRVSKQGHRSTSQLVTIDLQKFYALIWAALGMGKQASVVQTNVVQTNDHSDPESPDPSVRIQTPKKDKSDRELLRAYLSCLHSWLESQKDQKARELYNKGIQKTFSEVERALSGMVKAKLDNEATQDVRMALFISARTIFQLFLPLEQRGVMCGKIWGAVYTVITGVNTNSGNTLGNLQRVSRRLTEVAREAARIKAQLSQGRLPAPDALPMPPNILRAWHYFLLCFLALPADMAAARTYAERCEKLIVKSHQQLMRNPVAKKLEDTETLVPNALLTFIVDRVLSDFCGAQPDVVASYWEYLDQLKLRVIQDPLNRQNQAKVSALINEAEIIYTSLESQVTAASKLEGTLFPDNDTNIKHYYRSATPNTVPDIIDQAYPALDVLRERLRTLKSKHGSIHELLYRAESLLNKNKEEIRLNKDKQEAAIYVFTMVTVVFLPISTVASVLGMNTNDVRNMEKSQWVFWATAAPLTAVIVALGLFVSGILTVPRFAGRKWGRPRVKVEEEEEEEEEVFDSEEETEEGYRRDSRQGRW